MLAFQLDRFEGPDALILCDVPWPSPNGTPLSITAGYARWPGSDLTYALQPNGRFLDFRTPKQNDSIRPGGVVKKSYNDGLYLLGAISGFYAPKGSAFNEEQGTSTGRGNQRDERQPEERKDMGTNQTGPGLG